MEKTKNHKNEGRISMKMKLIKKLSITVVILVLLMTGCSNEGNTPTVSTNQGDAISTQEPQIDEENQDEITYVKALMGQSDNFGDSLVLRVVVTNSSGEKDVKIKEMDTKLKDKSGSLIHAMDDRLAQTITVEPQSDKELMVAFELQDTSNIQSIVIYDVDGNEVAEADFEQERISKVGPSNEQPVAQNQQGQNYAAMTESGLVLYEFGFQEDDITSSMVGIIQNTSNKTMEGVSVRFAIYDQGGYQIEETEDYLATLKPGGQWKFKAYIVDETAHRAELIELSHY